MLAMVAVGAIGLAIWMAVGDSATNDVRASVASLFVGLCALALTVLDRPVEPPPADSEQLADDLAATVNQQWLGEARIRDLRDPQVLPLVWTSGDAGPLFRVDIGAFDEVTRLLARAYRSVPGGRLVVLGEPGAGKSVVAVLLTLGMLGGRDAGDRVPVLLNASSWDPVSQALPEWIVTTLAATYYAGERRIPQALVDDDLVVPVLDGLDEIPETSRRSAIRRINDAVGAHRPIIVTCRSAEYADVLRNGAPTLHRAPVVTVQPVSGADLAAYVELVGWPEHVDWKPVLAEIHENPDGDLAAALSTPLMISVARAVYRNSTAAASPVELLDVERFDTRHAIEDHLVDELVTASFADRPGRWPADKARRWLTFLAEHLHRYRERDLSWWRMADRLLSPWTAPAVGLVIGLLIMTGVSAWLVAFTDPDRTTFSDDTLGPGAVIGGAMTILATVLWFAGVGAVPSRLAIAVKGSAGRLLSGFLAGFSVVAMISVPIAVGLGVVAWMDADWTFTDTVELSDGLWVSLAVAAVAGAGVSVHALLKAPPERSRQTTPAGRLTGDRWSSLIGAAAAGEVVALIVLPTIMVGVIAGDVTGGTVAGWAGLSGTPSLWAEGSSPTVDHDAIGHVVMASALCGFCCTVLVLLSRAWPRFLVLRAALAVRGRAPWRLMAFLAEAHRRDLLRESGGVYQFRHIRLQERLAEQAGATFGRARGGAVAGPWSTARRLVTVGVVAVLVIGGWSVNAMNNHLHCRPLSAMPGPVEQVRIFTGSGSGCYGVVAEQGWDALGPPRAAGVANSGRYVLEQLRKANGSTPADAPVVAVVAPFSDPDPIVYEYLVQQLSGVAVAQVGGGRQARVVLFDAKPGESVDDLLGAWRSGIRLSAVIRLGDDLDQSEARIIGLDMADPSSGHEMATTAPADVNYLLRRYDPAVPAVGVADPEIRFPTRQYDDWRVAGGNICAEPVRSIGIYTGPGHMMDEFSAGVARWCAKPPPLLIIRRAAVEHLLRRSPRDYPGWTFYYPTAGGTSVVGGCRGVDSLIVDGYRTTFPGQGEACGALLGGSAIAAYRAMHTVQQAAGEADDQGGLDQRIRHLGRGYGREAIVVIRMTAAPDAVHWRLDLIKL
ncbi:hypothetical protein L3i22_083100 [Actinoplanes sp. L3-i22]|nr:hypothetical protein L3i22_083100 [Actinoplanes sp. L3-i22]